MKGYKEWNGIGLPPVGSVVVLQNVDTVFQEDFDGERHCTVDLWTNSQPLEVLAHRKVNQEMTAIVFNLYTRQASGVRPEYYRPESPEDRL